MERTRHPDRGVGGGDVVNAVEFDGEPPFRCGGHGNVLAGNGGVGVMLTGIFHILLGVRS